MVVSYCSYWLQKQTAHFSIIATSSLIAVMGHLLFHQLDLIWDMKEDIKRREYCRHQEQKGIVMHFWIKAEVGSIIKKVRGKMMALATKQHFDLFRQRRKNELGEVLQVRINDPKSCHWGGVTNVTPQIEQNIASLCLLFQEMFVTNTCQSNLKMLGISSVFCNLESVIEGPNE